MQQAVQNAQNGTLHTVWSTFQYLSKIPIINNVSTTTLYRSKHYLDQKCNHRQSEVTVRIVQVFDDALGPLETLFAERTTTIQRHNSGKIFHLFAFLRADLQLENTQDKYHVVHSGINRFLRERCFPHCGCKAEWRLHNWPPYKGEEPLR